MITATGTNRSESGRQPTPNEPRPTLVQIRAPDERDVAGLIARVICAGTYDSLSQDFAPQPARTSASGLQRKSPVSARGFSKGIPVQQQRLRSVRIFYHGVRAVR